MPAVDVAVAVDVEAATADGNKVFGFFDEFSAFFFCMLLVSAWGDDSGTFGAAFVAQAETEVKLQKQAGEEKLKSVVELKNHIKIEHTVCYKNHGDTG